MAATTRHYRHWTTAEDRRLRNLWGSASLYRVAATLGRTALTVHWRARKLGLVCGVPEGHEYLTHAAKRTGFSVSQLRRILRAADVSICCTISRPTRAKRRFHYVDPLDVDDAVAAWATTETVEAAARARGLVGETLRQALIRAGLEAPARKRYWRVPSETIDRVVAEEQAKLSVRAHAARLGIHRETLAKRLRAAGVLGAEKRPGNEVRLPNDVVDAALEMRRAG